MRSFKKRASSVLLVICMGISVILCKPAAAIVASSEYLDWYRATLTAKSGGDIAITVSVDACGDMDKVGASEIYLYESSTGTSFHCAEIYEYSEYPTMMGSGWNYHKAPVTYKGTPGYAYYAIVYCYAGDSSGHDEKQYTTSIVYAKG